LRNMGVAPAGSDRANSGHHHLLIDTELPANEASSGAHREALSRDGIERLDEWE